MPNLGVKYGLTLRRRYLSVWNRLKKKRICPKCGSTHFRRKVIGIWECEKCGFKVAGDAYDLVQE